MTLLLASSLADDEHGEFTKWKLNLDGQREREREAGSFNFWFMGWVSEDYRPLHSAVLAFLRIESCSGVGHDT